MGIERLREWERLHPERVKGYVPPQFQKQTYIWSNIEPGESIDLSFLSEPDPPRPKKNKKNKLPHELRKFLIEEMKYALAHLDHGEWPDAKIFATGYRPSLYSYEIPEGYQEIILEKEDLPIETWLTPDKEE